MRKEIREFSGDGILIKEYTLVNDKIHGVHKGYYPGGERYWETPYLDGEVHGVIRYYYKMGELCSETSYLSGKRHGLCKGYYETGELNYEIYYLNENVVTAEEYNNSINLCKGKVVEVEGNGMRKEVKEFNDKDVLIEKYTLVNDKKHGVGLDYYEDGGELYSESSYLNGELHGVQTVYYESGKLWYETPYLNGKEHGITRHYHPSGALDWEWFYLSGAKVPEKEYNNSLNSCEGKVVEVGGKKYELREIK